MRGIYFKDDYVGFTFNGIHSSQFGLLCASSGDRYVRNLSPEQSDTTVQVTGSQGTLYFGTTHRTQSFSFNVAFDTVLEKEIREIKNWLNCGIAPLIFDELPYIQYYCKIARMPQLGFIAFDDELYGRVYKGEIKLDFIAYDPYGYSVSKWLEDYGRVGPNNTTQPIELYCSNVTEWAESSRLQPKQEYNNWKWDIYQPAPNEGGGGRIQTYNGGDVKCDFTLNIDVKDNSKYISIIYEGEPKLYIDLDEAAKILEINTTGKKQRVKIDTKKRLTMINYGVANNGEIEWEEGWAPINGAVSGDYFKLEKSEYLTDCRIIDIYGASNVEIDYQYKYL